MTQASHGWQPIETAPHEGTVFLAFVPHDQVGFAFVGVRSTKGRLFCMMTLDDYTAKATHWMPLPEFPPNKTMTPTPRTDAEAQRITLDCDDSCVEIYIKQDGKTIDGDIVMAEFARQLETELAELNERLIDRQNTLMAALVDLRTATRILTRCRDSAGRVEIGLYEDIQNFLHTQP